MSTEPDSELKIWKLTGFGAGSGLLVFGDGFGFGVNFIFLTPPISVVRTKKILAETLC